MSKKNRRTAKQPFFKTPIILAILGGAALLFAALLLTRDNPKANQNFNPEVTGGASLKTDQSQINLGDTKLGDWVSASFNVTNVGDKPLQFTKKPYIQVVEGC